MKTARQPLGLRSPDGRAMLALTALVALLTAAFTLTVPSEASASTWDARYNAGFVEPTDKMTIGYDVVDPDEHQLTGEIKAGPLLVGVSPVSPARQRVAITVYLHRWNAEAGAWQSWGASKPLELYLTGATHEVVGDGASANAWTFKNLSADAGRYEVVYSLTWFETDADGDSTNDKILGQGILKPSAAGDHACRTTAFALWPIVSYEVPCSVTDHGIVI